MKTLFYTKIMHFEIIAHSRNDLIQVGNTLGRIFKDSGRDRPWMVTMSRDGNSGKSLVGSSIDQIYDPEFYPDGITADHYADLLMYQKPKGSVTFLNVCNDAFNSKAEFDARLGMFERNHPASHVLICANMRRMTLQGEFNYRAKGLQSDRLDMNIDFHVLEGTFNRRLAITTENDYVCKALRTNGLCPG